LQSWGVPVLYGAGNIVKADKSVNGGGVPVISYSANTPIQFSDAPKEFKQGLEFVSPNAKITELEEGITKAMARIKEHYGLQSQGALPTKNVKAADTLQMENSKLEEYRDRIKEVFGFAITDIFNLVTIIYNAHAEGQKLSGKGVSVNFLESDVSKLSVDDKIKETTFALEQNTKSIVDVFIEESDDDITPDEAEKQIIKNAETNARIKRAVTALNPQPTVVAPGQIDPTTGKPALPGNQAPGAPGAGAPAPQGPPKAPKELPVNPNDQKALDDIQSKVPEEKVEFIPKPGKGAIESPDNQPMRNQSDHMLTIA
jgi:hypothetical protein